MLCSHSFATYNYQKHFFSLAGHELCALVENFRYEYGSGSLIEDVKSDFSRVLGMPVEHIQDVTHYMLGWVKAQVDERISTDQAPIVSRDDFSAEFGAIIRKLDRSAILVGVSHVPSATDNAEWEGANFVKQLELIGFGERAIVSAAINRRKALNDVVHWARNGRVHESSYSDFEDDLQQTWENQKDNIDIIHNAVEDEGKGRLLHNECMQYRAKLQGYGLEQHFVRGFYHDMSNALKIGWHPDYLALIEGAKDE